MNSSVGFGKRDEAEVRQLIKKDVERTLQDYELFKNKAVQQRMEEILLIWAKEHPQYKYQ